MTRPAPSSKVILLEDRRGGAGGTTGASVRRYRLARLRLDGYPTASERRFDYLKRTHD
ncbi:MAG: hypothetical protein ACJ764_10370 [Solirubrobacteraceae bacterium]